MTDEEYLRASGWEWQGRDGLDDYWAHSRHTDSCGHPRDFALAEAVEAQLAEDRARYNFVRERSATEGDMLVESPIARCPHGNDRRYYCADCEADAWKRL